MKRIFLDYASTTPVDKRVLSAMKPYFSDTFGNSYSLHSFGIASERALKNSRKIIAQFINADASEIFFTSSDTESNNLALKGIAFANKSKGNHIIISDIEHDSVSEVARWLKSQGFKITKIPVDKYGLVNPEDVKSAITDKTILVSIIFASNEIGTIQPIKEIAKMCREKNVYFHTDASQAFGKIPIDVKKLGIDLMSAGSHKIYGPKGAAMLYIRKGIFLEPLLHGGGQEQGMRSSTVNVPAIVGFSKAVEIRNTEMLKEGKKNASLRDFLIQEVLKIKGSKLNGPPAQAGHSKERLPGLISFSFSDVGGELLASYLDVKGFAVSTGSACSSSDKDQVRDSIRVSLGNKTTLPEIKAFIKTVSAVVKKLRYDKK